MANPRKRSRGWFLLAVIPARRRILFRAIAQPDAAEDRRRKAGEGGAHGPGALGGGHREDRAHHQGGDQIQGFRYHLEAAGECGRPRTAGASDRRAGPERSAAADAAGAGGARHGGRGVEELASRVRASQSGGRGPDVPFLKRDMERVREMFAQKVAPRMARDEAEKNYELGKNRQQQAVVNLGVAQAAIRKAEAQVEQSRAQLSTTEEDLRNATIVSPIDGVVLSRDREVGDAVSSILTMGSGATLIMTVGDLREVYVKGKVDESDIGKVFLGQGARITVESYKDQKFAGKVTKISPMGVEKDNVTTFEVRVSISNEAGKLMATMTANAEILLEERKVVLAVPEGAIIYKKDRTIEVEVPDAGTETGRRRVTVATGIGNGSRTQIMSGLNEGQQVILQ